MKRVLLGVFAASGFALLLTSPSVDTELWTVRLESRQLRVQSEPGIGSCRFFYASGTIYVVNNGTVIDSYTSTEENWEKVRLDIRKCVAEELQ